MSDAHGVARDQLRAFVERIERLEEEKNTINKNGALERKNSKFNMQKGHDDSKPLYRVQ